MSNRVILFTLLTMFPAILRADSLSDLKSEIEKQSSEIGTKDSQRIKLQGTITSEVVFLGEAGGIDSTKLPAKKFEFKTSKAGHSVEVSTVDGMSSTWSVVDKSNDVSFSLDKTDGKFVLRGASRGEGEREPSKSTARDLADEYAWIANAGKMLWLRFDLLESFSDKSPSERKYDGDANTYSFKYKDPRFGESSYTVVLDEQYRVQSMKRNFSHSGKHIEHSVIVMFDESFSSTIPKTVEVIRGEKDNPTVGDRILYTFEKIQSFEDDRAFKIEFFGIERQVLESMLGELPVKRTGMKWYLWSIILVLLSIGFFGISGWISGKSQNQKNER